MANTTWYHGGDFKEGKPKGIYVYLTDSRQFAATHAREHPTGIVYRLRPEYNHLVVDHQDGGGRKAIRQAELQQHGGVLSVFEEAIGEIEASALFG